eukprot:TRINITY_DN4164_c0_g1_i18.p1 TRINITY_DN4164_c0_g1~~TRINITY_DN4164_c0_g1_i18.p1  ORF type:complete len:328 (+),score=100.14 TRINITY_DN4164_c0_g1_i18:50-1033(+)
MQNVTFKLFHQDEIRRVTVARPSFAQFLEYVHELFPEIKPEVKITYIDSDGDKVTVSSEVEWNCALDEQKNEKIVRFTIESGVPKKGSTQPVHVSFYTEQANEDVRQAKIQALAGSIPALLEKYFEGPVTPKTIPAWLKPAVKFLPQGVNEFDLDINVRALFDVLHKKAFDLLALNNNESTLKAKFIFMDCLFLEPSNIYALYNLACAEALLGETSSALDYLKKAIKNGYKNWSHMQSDTDLTNLRGTTEFKELLNSLRHGEQAQEKKEETASAEKEKEEKIKLAAARESAEETNKRAMELIRFAEQRRIKLEEEARELAKERAEQH